MLKGMHKDLEPFTYITQKNFLSSELLTQVYNKWKNADHGDYWITCYDDQNKQLQEHAKKLWRVRKKLVPHTPDMLNILNCNKNDSFFRIMVKVMDPGTSHHEIHTDANWKQMTTIVYISPEGLGTLFYKGPNEKDFVKEVRWKQNLAYSFIPANNSWHNFKHLDGMKDKRIVLMFTLCNKTFYR